MTETETPELEYLTLREYADAIGKSPRTVQRQLATGEITSDKKLPGATGDHLFRADREDVQRGGQSHAPHRPALTEEDR